MRSTRQPNLEPVQVEAALRKSINYFKGDAESRDIDFDLDLGSREVFVKGLNLAGTFSSLIANSIRGIQNNGVIRIRLELIDDSVRILVEDTGHGIEEAQQSKVFNAFTSYWESEKGLGLGLPLARRQVNAGGGSLHLAPTDSQGACFEIILPALAQRSSEEDGSEEERSR